MVFNFINWRGDILPLWNNDYFYIIETDGQTVANTNISSVVVGGSDGDEVNNVQTQPRTIILTLHIKSGVDVEEAKRYILNVVKLKKKGSILWEQNRRSVTISGIVESIELPRWQNGIAMQITLHCSQPFWEDTESTVQLINESISLHYFTDTINDMLYFPIGGIALSEYDIIRTRTIHNSGDVDIGLDIEILAYDTVTNPIIRDTDNNFFGVGYGTGTKKVVMSSGDLIKITTHKGNKTVTLNGDSVINKIKPQSTWLQLQAGDNTFSINSDDTSTENMGFALSYKRRYV